MQTRALRDDSCESTARKILKVFDAEDLGKISWNARKTVDRFTYKSAADAQESVPIDVLK